MLFRSVSQSRYAGSRSPASGGAAASAASAPSLQAFRPDFSDVGTALASMAQARAAMINAEQNAALTPYKMQQILGDTNYRNIGVGGGKSGHPAVFPEALAQDHILSWSNENDTVLDCFCGSGTTPKMAKLLNRHYIGIDTPAEYVALANERLAQLERGLTNACTRQGAGGGRER